MFGSGENHLLRKIDRMVSFDFIYELLAPYYSATGRPSVDPVSMFNNELILQSICNTIEYAILPDLTYVYPKSAPVSVMKNTCTIFPCELPSFEPPLAVNIIAPCNFLCKREFFTSLAI